MEAELLKKQIDEETAQFLNVGQAVLADGKIDCDEAKHWLAWFSERKQSLNLLKREINLQMRKIRNDHQLQSASATIRGEKTRLREALTKALDPYQRLLEQIERLLLEGEKVKPTLQKMVDTHCE